MSAASNFMGLRFSSQRFYKTFQLYRNRFCVMNTKTMNMCEKCDKPGVFVCSRLNDTSHPIIVCDQHILTINTTAPAPAPVPAPAPALPSYMNGFDSELSAMRAERMSRYAAITESLKAASAQSRGTLMSELSNMKATREARYASILGQLNSGIQGESVTRQINTWEIKAAIDAKKEGHNHDAIMAQLEAEEAALAAKINKS